jgi:hypothetical protein
MRELGDAGAQAEAFRISSSRTTGSHVRLLIGLLLSFLIAACVGLGSTWYAVTKNLSFGELALGAWRGYPRHGTADIDPYARAALVRTGGLPVGIGDGIAFTASADDNGRPLDGRCDTVVQGTTPPARYFTLSLYTPAGRLVANSLDRHGFTSQELVRDSTGEFQVLISPRARPGNWLPTGGIDRYVLMMRFYDTSLGIATRAGREAPMPSVRATGDCR